MAQILLVYSVETIWLVGRNDLIQPSAKDQKFCPDGFRTSFLTYIKAVSNFPHQSNDAVEVILNRKSYSIKWCGLAEYPLMTDSYALSKRQDTF